MSLCRSFYAILIGATDMRAKFGVNGTENAGDSGKAWGTVGRVSA